MSTLQPEMQQIWHLMNINKPKFSPGVQVHPAVPPPILFSKSAPVGYRCFVFCGQVKDAGSSTQIFSIYHFAYAK